MEKLFIIDDVLKNLRMVAVKKPFLMKGHWEKRLRDNKKLGLKE